MAQTECPQCKGFMERNEHGIDFSIVSYTCINCGFVENLSAKFDAMVRGGYYDRKCKISFWGKLCHRLRI